MSRDSNNFPSFLFCTPGRLHSYFCPGHEAFPNFINKMLMSRGCPGGAGGGGGTCALLELSDAYVYVSSFPHRLMKASRRDQNATIRIKSDYIVSQTKKQKKQTKESSVSSLRETISPKWQNFAKLISTLYRQMPPTIQLIA